MKRLMCFFVIMLLMIPVVGFSDGGVDKSEDQEGSSSICDIKDKEGNSIVNPTVNQVIESETDANYKKCLYYQFDDVAELASEQEQVFCPSEKISEIKNLACFSGIFYLQLYRNNLSSLDISGNKYLEYVDLGNNKFKKIPKGTCMLLNDKDNEDDLEIWLDLNPFNDQDEGYYPENLISECKEKVGKQENQSSNARFYNTFFNLPRKIEPTSHDKE